MFDFPAANSTIGSMDAAEAPAAIEFGRFAVLPHRRELLAEGRPVELGGRAFDVLMALIEASGVVVSKDTLMEQVWPNRIVEENSLQAQISALRRAFGADRDLIRTIAGRGYQFAGEIRAVSTGPGAQATARTPQPTLPLSQAPTNLPEPVSELIGRDSELNEILDLSTSHRLVTLAGAGGIGKTRLGFEAARHLLPRFADGVWVVELAPLSDPELVPVTVATVLGLELSSGAASPQSVATALRSKQFMLVLDNCEHVVDAAARMTEALLRTNPAARVIATSREPLRTEGEWVYPVPPLAVPAEGSSNGENLLRYGAVRLFAERARAAAPHFSTDGRAAAAVADICRHLDGIPLAIELAAARAAALGVDGLAARLHNRFRLLTGGQRTATPRHQTLRATLDWSYELLTEPERVVLRRLAIFAGGFTLRSARGVAADDGVTGSDVVDCVANLVAKSLVTADAAGAGVRYWLLETTRAYSVEKLVEAGEFDAVARRHARRCLDLFEGAEAEAETRPTAEWLADHGPRIDNVRAALDWAFTPVGDASIGVALTAAAIPLWMHLSLMEECRDRVERALAALVAGASSDARCEMQLSAALGASLMYTKGPVPETDAAWTRALELAESLGDATLQLSALWGLSFYRSISGEHRTELALAQRFYNIAASRMDPADLRVGDRMMGTSLHYLGDQVAARRHIERMLALSTPVLDRVRLYRFQFDQSSAARCVFSHILWLQGFPEQAVTTSQASVDGARISDHALSVCNALAQAACPIAFCVGDLPAAEHFASMLVEHSERHALAVWQIWSRCWQGAILIRRGEVVAGLPLLGDALDALRRTGYVLRYTGFLGVYAEGLGAAGQVAQGLMAIEEALARSERSDGRWCVAELLRVKGELRLLDGGPNAGAAAEDHFRQALEWARRQGALSWELRCATSLARSWRDQARSDEARALLASAYDRFTEGFATADLRAARELLDELS
jgi:predicted ATPase/DNA-binding winged helix-turn-helix (wHTH) protein